MRNERAIGERPAVASALPADPIETLEQHARIHALATALAETAAHVHSREPDAT